MEEYMVGIGNLVGIILLLLEWAKNFQMSKKSFRILHEISFPTSNHRSSYVERSDVGGPHFSPTTCYLFSVMTQRHTQGEIITFESTERLNVLYTDIFMIYLGM